MPAAEHPPLLCPWTQEAHGTEVVIGAPGRELFRESWGARTPNAREKVTFGRPELYADAELYVRTAVLRQPGWKPELRGPRVRTAADVADILEHMTRLDHERVVILMLDPDSRLIAIHEAAVGGLHGCALTPRDVVRLPVLVGAARIVVVHNHPSGDPNPSAEDVRMTRAIELACGAVGVQLVDHVVLARGPIWSSIGALGGAGMLSMGLAAADRVLRDPRPAEELAVSPYGKYRKFLVRSALVEAEGQPGQRPELSSFDAVMASSPVRQLMADVRGEERLLTLCLDGKNGLMAAHVTRGAVHGVEAPHVYAVASTVPTSAIVLAHNHPQEGGSPGEEDRAMSAAIIRGLEAIGCALLDHIVVWPGEAVGTANAVSLLEIGMLGR